MYEAAKDRYTKMKYRRCGKTGIVLPVLSYGLWWNFGESCDYEKCKEMIFSAFDNGITHFDLANNYGPPPGQAEITFGKILKDGLNKYRNQIIISTKAGYTMHEGPYQNGGMRKYLISSLDESLERMGLNYVDIFYHHRFDKDTPLFETMLALRDIVLSGKALYVGLSNYNSKQLKQAVRILKHLNVPYLITQPSYSMLNRWIEKDNLLNNEYKLGGGTIAYSILQQGILSNKYLDNDLKDARINKPNNFVNKRYTKENIEKLKKLEVIASSRKQSISQMAIAWSLRNEKMTSVLISTSKLTQLDENLKALDNLVFTKEEIKEIDNILK
jgi:L-glyceraldehyde 3-phosphate reductase